MRLYVDLETLQLIEGPGFRNPVTSLRFKRGDAALLDVTFLSNGTTAAAIGDPATLELQFGIKPRGRYDVGYLVHTADWTLPDPEAESPSYQCSPSFNTVELDSAMQVGSSTGTELSEVTLMGEITWREGTGEPTSSRTFLVVVENDVNRGTEGVPTDAEPPYPAAENVEIVSRKGVANGYAGLDSGGKVPAAQLAITAASISDSTSTGRALIKASSTAAARTAIGAGSIGSSLITQATRRGARVVAGLEVVSCVVDASGFPSQSPAGIVSQLLSYHLLDSLNQVAALTLLLDSYYFNQGYTVAQLVDAILASHYDSRMQQVRWLVIEKMDAGSGLVGDFRISNSSSVDVHWDGSGYSLDQDDVIRVQILDNAANSGSYADRVQAIVEYIGSEPGGGSSTSS